MLLSNVCSILFLKVVQTIYLGGSQSRIDLQLEEASKRVPVTNGD